MIFEETQNGQGQKLRTLGFDDCCQVSLDETQVVHLLGKNK